ncbi:MAG TPA: SMP-30/gluconolactonase/LRE family protein [Polyangia bacterium]|nr:SMP-30/gluconolactonase/LRE family protein [Polyangia bacterium]
MRIQKLDVPACALGEGPLWSEREQRLFFVDIVNHRVHAYRPASTSTARSSAIESWQFDRFTGSLAECRSGGLIATQQDRIVRFDPARGLASLEVLAVLESDRPANRLNDGRADARGRFWVGSMQHDEKAHHGRLWCVTADGRARAVRDDIGVSNSISFDPARNRMYFADSMAKLIEQTTLDADGMPTTWQPFARTDKGGPDGSCTDAEGFLWNAEWGASRVVRYAPTGEIDRVVTMPVTRPSCPAFGGKDLRTLFVTSARYLMSPEEDRTDVDAGSLFAIELDDVRGVPANLFAL